LSSSAWFGKQHSNIKRWFRSCLRESDEFFLEVEATDEAVLEVKSDEAVLEVKADVDDVSLKSDEVIEQFIVII
jgi:hypothetical protein